MASEDSPSKRSGLQRLNDQNAQLRNQLTLVQNEKFELHKLVKKHEAEVKILEMKHIAIENELEKQKIENNRFIEAYEKQKKERLLLINDKQTVLNNLNRDSVQMSKLANENKLLKEQVETLEKSLETEKTERVNAIRQKQNNANKVKLLESKLQAATMQAKFSKASSLQRQSETALLKQTISGLEQRLSESQGPLQVQTIYRQSSGTTQKLLKDFEKKMKQKQAVMVKQMQNYEKKNSSNILRIAELETQLLTLRK